MSLSVQFSSLLAMIGTGIIAASIIDLLGTTFNQLKVHSKLKKYFIVIEVAAWMLVGAFAFLVLYYVRDGAWRMYDPIAQVSGLLLYVSFFHRPFRFIGKVIYVLLVRPIWLLFRSLYLMARFIVKFIISFVVLLSSPFRSIYDRLQKKL